MTSRSTDDKKAANKVHYNLGNALYKAGTAREDKDIQAAIKSLEEALPHYEKVMAADPKDKDAPVSHDFVKKEIERLKKKMQEQKQNKTCPNPQKKDGSDQKKDEGSSGKKDQSSPQDQKGQDSQNDQQNKQDGKNSPQKDKAGQDQPQQQEQPADQGGQKNKDGSSPEKDASGKDQGQKAESPSKDNPSSGQAGEGQISSEKEARVLLDDFDQNEQPKGLLNFIREKRDARPVEKDW
ncbi:MAG: hypothetical protein HQL18_03980 [Candidatus Omnitrophica bacterium]|nr:hypothetical protein [Candidatus Omnitrophota bacterium]